MITLNQTATVTAPTAPPMISITTPTLHPTRFTTSLHHPPTIIHPHDTTVNGAVTQPADIVICGYEPRLHSATLIVTLSVSVAGPVVPVGTAWNRIWVVPAAVGSNE